MTYIRRLLLLLFIIVPLVLIRPVTAKGHSSISVKSIDVVYDVRVNSVMSVIERIEFSDKESSVFIRRIPKKGFGIKNSEFREINYSVKEVRVFGGEKGGIKYKLSEDNNEVKVSIDLSGLTENTNFVTLKYKIERAISEVEKKDDQNIRNNIQLLGSLMVMGSSADENIVKSLTVKIKSPDAVFAGVECYGGDIENKQRMCLSEFDANEGRVYSTTLLGEGKGFLVLFKMMKGGEVEAPGKAANFFAGLQDYLRVNWREILITTGGLLLIVYVLSKIFYIKRTIS